MNTLFLDACKRKPTPRTPVWMMRQAGRYLPEYRAIRATTDFLTLCKTPELASEVTIQPVDILGVDAAIIFSDILVVPEAMGMQLIIEEGKGGPRFPSPLRTADDIDRLVVPDPDVRLRYVMDALRLTRQRLNDRVPVIGFSGSPWTLAAYMVEGHGTKNFRYPKELLFNEPALAQRLLAKLADAVSAYLSAQVAAGAQAVQIFDTWGGILTPDLFREFSLRWIGEIVARLRPTGVPVIVFCKDCSHSLEQIAATGCHVIGCDWTTDIGEARRRVGAQVALQGNMDPTILYAAPERIRSEVRSVLAKYGHGPGHIFNLGHGILPDIPVDHARVFIRSVQEESAAYHR
jgi:uroporphyrinogen decarboxylase